MLWPAAVDSDAVWSKDFAVLGLGSIRTGRGVWALLPIDTAMSIPHLSLSPSCTVEEYRRDIHSTGYRLWCIIGIVSGEPRPDPAVPAAVLVRPPTGLSGIMREPPAT